MQTQFSLAQLANSDMRDIEKILRSCVHCGLCLSVCPTYTLLADERDSPRGRIYLMKDMFEKESKPNTLVREPLDRCLTCLACTDVCPSAVDYQHLIDYGRYYIEKHHKRPLFERLLRRFLAFLIPRTSLFRLALNLGRIAKPFSMILPKNRTGKQLRALLTLTPKRNVKNNPLNKAGTFPVKNRQYRVAILPGCAQRVLSPQINAATIRILNRHGCEVIAPALGCCGSLGHHLGQNVSAYIKRVVDSIWTLMQQENLDAFVINASGCGTTVKDYAHILRDDPNYAPKAKAVAAITQDISEFLAKINLSTHKPKKKAKVAYHGACSLNNGQKIKHQPIDLLRKAGFDVVTPKEEYLCCGSAGVYNILEPEIASALLTRKATNINALEADWIATGNIGCITQISQEAKNPVVHIVELLDWATGGPKPQQ